MTLRYHQTQVHQGNVHEEQPNQAVIPLNIARYRKTASTALWLQLTLVVCYLQFGIVDATTTISEISSFVLLVREFTVSLVYFNSSLNPILYCWKIEEVREAAMVQCTCERRLFPQILHFAVRTLLLSHLVRRSSQIKPEAIPCNAL